MSTTTSAPSKPRRTRVTFHLEKGVPIPAKPKQQRVSIYPFHEMEIGDSFAAANLGPKSYQRIYQAARIHANRYNKSFVVRAVTERGQPVIRAWRINPDEA